MRSFSFDLELNKGGKNEAIERNLTNKENQKQQILQRIEEEKKKQTTSTTNNTSEEVHLFLECSTILFLI